MIAEYLSPTDRRWTKALELLEHDVYHTPAYVVHAANHEGGTATCFMAEMNGATLLLPLLLRSLPESLTAPENWLDAASPYGYPGPLITPQTDSETAAGLFDCFVEASIQRSIVTAFVRVHPFFPLADSSVACCGELVHHGDTVYVDLELPSEEQAKQVRSGHRYEIRRLVKTGFHVVMNDWSYYEAFKGLYEETMRRVDARESYYFSAGYFDDFRALIDGRLHFGCVLSPHGELASASLFTESCGTVQYHLSATAGGFVRQSPSKLLLDHVSDWAKARGNSRLHLGGGVGAGEDSLFRFKAGFSNSRAKFYTLRCVFDRQKYETLTRHSQHGSSGIRLPANFFPGYRHAA